MLGILALVAGLVVLVGWLWTVFLAFSIFQLPKFLC